MANPGKDGLSSPSAATDTRVESLRQEVAALRWFHRIELAPGFVTPGGDASQQRLSRMRWPESFAGKTVLDVGAWDGYYSFEAERRGATDVLATDSFSWNGAGWADRRGFDLAHRALGSKVRALEVDPMDLSAQAVGGTYDVVFFFGVLYHLRHPLWVLQRLASVTRELLILETEVDNLLVPWPSLAFYPERELNDDPTNWFGPNAKAVEGMLRAVGFREIECVWRSSFPRRVARAIKMRFQGGHPFLRGLGRDRRTWHARK
jgi:tRNA (mo5U34)-methyltransferase